MLIAAVWVGTLLSWILAALAIAAAVRFTRGGGGMAIDSLEKANRVLEREVKELRAEVAALTLKLTAAEARTDVVTATQPFIDWANTHETNAAKRADAILDVLGLIAQRLGSDKLATEANQ